MKATGEVREYQCRLAWSEPGLVVVRFDMTGGATAAAAAAAAAPAFSLPVRVPPGSYSLGFFWKRRPYDAYRLVTPGGEVLAHRFDAVTGVSFGEGFVEYHDLVLDWWALPDGTLLEEDREELAELLAAGTVTAAQAAEANLAAQAIFSRYRHIIDELDLLAARIG